MMLFLGNMHQPMAVDQMLKDKEPLSPGDADLATIEGGVTLRL